MRVEPKPNTTVRDAKKRLEETLTSQQRDDLLALKEDALSQTLFFEDLKKIGKTRCNALYCDKLAVFRVEARHGSSLPSCTEHLGVISADSFRGDPDDLTITPIYDNGQNGLRTKDQRLADWQGNK